eukprot:Skav210615  [mRNA]  locus=scaffold234:295045:295665:+ [translate_table: standard]
MFHVRSLLSQFRAITWFYPCPTETQVRPQDIHFAPAGRFIFGKPLGKGQSSQVMEVTDTTTGRTDLAAKVSEGGKSHQELLQEAMVLKALNSSCRGFPEFIGLFADAERPDTRFMVLQRFRCSVEDLRRENPSMGGLGVVQTVGMQVLSQLQAMHQLNLAHGDLKPKNIAVASVNPLKILRFSEKVLFISGGVHGFLFFSCGSLIL